MPVRRAGRSWNLLDVISASAGSTIDSVYAAFAYRFGASPPFFKEGWGDLGKTGYLATVYQPRCAVTAAAQSLKLQGWSISRKMPGTLKAGLLHTLT